MNYSNGTWLNAATAEDDIKIFSSLGDAPEECNLCFALKDAESGYMMELPSPNNLNLSMDYENSMLNITASAGTDARFSPEGCISLEGEQTDYDMQMVLNEEYLVTDWYYFSTKGTSADHAKLEKTESGYILSASNLKNIRAEGYNDEQDCFVQFSSDSDSVLFYEIDALTIGVKEDTNGDGIYDTEIARSAPRKKGDIDGNTFINAKDAASVLVSAANSGAGKDTGFTRAQLADADVNQDDAINALDAAAILTYTTAVGVGNEDLSLEDFLNQ